MHPKQEIFDELFDWFERYCPIIDWKWHVAEFGVGKQGFASLYAQKFEKVYGIDIEDYSSYHKNVEFVLSKVNQIPLQDNCVDLVVSHSVLEHVENLNTSLAEINRILKPNGFLFLTVHPLYFSSFGAHIYQDGKRVDQWEHLIPGSPVYMSYEPPMESKERCATSLNGLTCGIFLQSVGLQPWNIIYFERNYECKSIPENVDRNAAPDIDLITSGMRFIGQKVPWPADINQIESLEKKKVFRFEKFSTTASSGKSRHIILKRLRNLIKQIHTYRAIRSSGLFDEEYYLKNNLDIAESNMNPIKHFIRHGWHEGRNPNKFFDTKWYLSKHRDVAASGMNPLYHFYKFGWKENRDPSIYFSTQQYLLANQEINDGKTNPLAHWLKFGQYKYPNTFTGIYRISEAELRRKVLQYNAQKTERKAKVVVYTAIIGNYDSLILPEYITDEWDYVCFTDTQVSGEHIFEIRKPDYLNSDPTRIARYIKTHPHFYFPGYEYAIWIDANILIRGPHLQKSLEYCRKNNILFMCNPHPHRNCVYDELQACIELNKDDKNIMEAQIERYKKDGFPEKAGLLETNILIRKHNDENVKAFNQGWWNEIENGSRRDQLSVTFTLWKSKLPYEILPDMLDVRNKYNKDYYMFRHKYEKDPNIILYT